MCSRNTYRADSQARFCQALSLVLLLLALGACSSPPATTNAPNPELAAPTDASTATYVPANAADKNIATQL
ncbi:MAG TPA: hypothetical protein VFR80_12530, partial [Pyrinomonadaceae bacterium]|nr:hypothetical protein [Pyrinomonadaceae bacterium]